MKIDKQKVLKVFDNAIKAELKSLKDSFEIYDNAIDASPNEKIVGFSIAFFAMYTVLKNFQTSKTIEKIRKKIIEEEE